MAASFISKPGTEFGPCKEDCIHEDCRWMKMIVASKCAICFEPIGYERRYFLNKDGIGLAPSLEHESCAYDLQMKKEQNV